MRPHLVLLCALFLALPAGVRAQSVSSIPEPVPCHRDDETCRENCTIEFGASFRQREKLGRCLQTCERRQDTCTRRWRELHLNAAKPPPEPKASPTPTANGTPTAAAAPDGGTEAQATVATSAPPFGVADPSAAGHPDAESVASADGGTRTASSAPAEDEIRLPSEEQLRGPPGTKARAAATAETKPKPQEESLEPLLELPRVFD